MSIDRYFSKRPRTSDDAEILGSKSTCGPSNVSLVLDHEEIIGDPALRKQILQYHPNLRDRVRREYISNGPCQPHGHDFPKTEFGKKMRAFREAWFQQYDWLEYSISRDAAFCFHCYLFRPTDHVAFGDDVFIKKGFRNWKKATEKFRDHVGDIGSAHNQARKIFDDFKNQRQSLPYKISNVTRELESDYYIRVNASLDVIRYLLGQGLAFRGNDESQTSLNKGNFLELLDWYSARNEEVKKVVGDNAPGNCKMTSPEIQRQLVSACAIETINALLSDIGDRKFSILVDESRDVSVKEQMAVALRYVNEHGAVIERFLSVVHVRDTSALCLKEAIDNLFARHGLSLSRLRGQGYDGASNMRGELNGLKTLILKENPSAMYVHCFAHQLQLVIVAVANENREVCDFFSYVGLIVNTTISSCKRMDQLLELEHSRMLNLIENKDITTGRGQNQTTSLARPGDTRWGSHYTTLIRLKSMWPSVIKVLQNVCHDGLTREVRSSANSLLKKMESYSFVFILHMMFQLLRITNSLSRALQERDQNIVQAVSLIETTKRQLQKFRDCGWEQLLIDVGNFCESNSIDVIDMNERIKTRATRREGQFVTNDHHYRVEIFNEVLDLILREMDDRFPELSTDLLLGVACLDPSNKFSKFNSEKLIRLAELYPQDFSYAEREELVGELATYIDNIREDNDFSNIKDLQNLSKKMIETRKSNVFSLVYRLIEMALLLPVATASVERAFSAMRFVKTDLRNKMGDAWMNDSMIVYIEREVFMSIDNDTIIRRFQSLDNRRVNIRGM